ncbi:nucleotidyltransferase family protein [Lysinibacillus sp. FSL K6-0075]|uniref:nucleotidyltransferase family protein n=1 Tax=Lysinibacillus sp. FSL K6-0075 TaxID=2921415 RepID=UPI0031594D81
MKDISLIKIAPMQSIKEAMQLLNDTSKQFLVVVNEENKLLGTLTDGDIRRAILNDISLSSPNSLIMNQNPIVERRGFDKQHYINTLKKVQRKQLPIVDENNRVVDVFFLEDWETIGISNSKVILMVGGLGTRLRPLTNEIPKPMLKVGKAPIIETIIRRFKEQGFQDFILAVNYKKEVIQNYLQDGKSFDVNIDYIEENQRLGTAGALSLIQDKFSSPVIIMNGDILTNVNFNNLIENHISSKACATVCVREYDYQIPYGVVITENNHLVDIQEKPIHKYLMNAGIYILNPEIIQDIPKNTLFDMPDLLIKLLNRKQKINVCTINDYWIDIGQIEDYKRANIEILGEKNV